MPDKDLIIIKWKGTTEESALLPELVTIEYAGQQIFLENGKIRVETIEQACHECGKIAGQGHLKGCLMNKWD